MDGGDFAEVFAEDRTSSTARYDDGRIEELTSGRDRGAGIRVIVGESTGYAHTADLSEAGLREAAAAAAGAARGGSGIAAHGRAHAERRALRPHEIEIPSESVPKETKLDLLRRADDAARSTGGAIKSVSASYAEGRRRILVANSDGLLTTDDQTPHALRGAERRIGRHRAADGHRGVRAQHGLRALRRDLGGRHRSHVGAPGAHAARGRAGAERAASRRDGEGRGKRAVPRGVRPWPRSRSRRPRRVGVQEPRRHAGGVAARHGDRRRHVSARVGHVRDRRRGLSRARRTC